MESETESGDIVELELHATGQRREPPDLHDGDNRQSVEAGIRTLPGVLAARLVPGYERPVDELHVVTTPDKSPKQVVRDVQSLLLAKYAVDMDHRVISVVQIDEPAEGSLSVDDGSRIVIEKVTATHDGLEVRVVVRLTDGDSEFVGEAAGPASAAGRRRATARAALEAVKPLLANRHVVEVEGVALADVLGHDVAIAFVHFHGPRGERTISGTALVRDDESAAIARSVLDALNREIQAASD